MTARLLHLVGIVAVGWAVTVGLRSLPFLLFARRRGELPRWVTTFGVVASPVIIAALIVYSYSGLAWRTVWPYLAGLLTVGLQLAMKNPLVSILAGTVLYMCALNCGCTSQRIIQLDQRDPSIRYSDRGITMNDETVGPLDVVRVLQDNDIPKDRVIHIRLAEGTRDLSGARLLMGILAKGGYTRPVLVTDRISESYNTGKPKKKPAASASGDGPKKIRYKKAHE